MTANDTAALQGQRLGIFGRGGAGKSTVTVLLARALHVRGVRLCVLDADSTNLGLAEAVGAAAPAPLLGYFGGAVFGGGAVTCPVDDPTDLPGAQVDLADLPQRYWATSPEGIRLLLAGKVVDESIGAGCDGPVGKIARDLIVTDHGEPLTLLVDFKAGFEDPARGLATGLDWGVVVADPSVAGMRMARDMDRMLAQLQAGGLPATAHLQDPSLIEIANAHYRESRLRELFYVVNRVRQRRVATQVRARLLECGVAVSAVIPDDDWVASSWLAGGRLASQQAQTAIDPLVDVLAAAAASAPRPLPHPQPEGV